MGGKHSGSEDDVCLYGSSAARSQSGCRLRRSMSWQAHGERRAFAFAFAFERHCAAVKLHDLPHDREAEAEASDLGSRFQSDLLKWLEHPVLKGGWNADSGILHRDGRAHLIALDDHGDPSALRRELHGVGKQIPEHLLETCSIALYQQRMLLGLHVQGQALVCD